MQSPLPELASRPEPVPETLGLRDRLSNYTDNLKDFGSVAVDGVAAFMPQTARTKAALMLATGTLGAVGMEATLVEPVHADGLIGSISSKSGKIELNQEAQPFKKCKKKGTPRVQIQAIGPTEITSTDQPYNYELLVKTCKSIKHLRVKESYDSGNQAKSWKYNARRNSIKTLSFQVQYQPLNIDISDPAYKYTCVGANMGVRATRKYRSHKTHHTKTEYLVNSQMRVPYSGQAACAEDESSSSR